MDRRLTLTELESRWETALTATRTAATRHYRAYRELKILAAEIVATPLDINDYFPAVEKLIGLLDQLDPCGRGSIFHIFKSRLSPSNLWQVRLLRMECRDLLAYLEAFETWRRASHHLRRVK
jgi:hypothetical protein